jgi:hypothetical protein
VNDTVDVEIDTNGINGSVENDAVAMMRKTMTTNIAVTAASETRKAIRKATPRKMKAYQ